MAICGDCEFDEMGLLDSACESSEDNTFLVKLFDDIDITPDGNTVLHYEVCGCEGNLNQAWFRLCPLGEGPQLDEEATSLANDPSTGANFVGIFDNQPANPFSPNRAALFTSLNEECNDVFLVYEGEFLPEQIEVGTDVVVGVFPAQDEITVSISGLFNCDQEPQPPEECDACGPTRAQGRAVTLTPPGCFNGLEFGVDFCINNVVANCRDCSVMRDVELCGATCQVPVIFKKITITGIATVVVFRELEGGCNENGTTIGEAQEICFTLECTACEDFNCSIFNEAVAGDPCQFFNVSLVQVNPNTVRPVLVIDCDEVRDAG